MTQRGETGWDGCRRGKKQKAPSPTQSPQRQTELTALTAHARQIKLNTAIIQQENKSRFDCGKD